MAAAEKKLRHCLAITDLAFLRGSCQHVITEKATRPPLHRLAGLVARDLWGALKPLIIFEIAFKSSAMALGALGTAWVISPLIARTGHAAITNAEIARFLISPTGMLVLVVLALSFLLGTMIEHIGVFAIASANLGGREATLAETLNVLKAVAVRALAFGAAKLCMLALLCAPFLLMAGLCYLVLLSRHDINFYLSEQPPSWYVAISIGTVLAAALGGILVGIYVSTIFAVPILLLEQRGALEAVGESRARTSGARMWIGAIVLGWQLLGLLLGLAIVWAFQRGCALALGAAGTRPSALVVVVALLLACHAVVLAFVSFVVVSVHCLLILQLYRARGGRVQTVSPAGAPGFFRWADPIERRLIRSKLAVLLALPIFLGTMAYSASGRLRTDEPVIVVAHRGYSRTAVENSMSAFRAAIEVGADMIELDVQETADGVVVVLHDRDLMRLAGDSRTITRITLAEARKIDIGRLKGPEFAGERIPTLAEVIALSRGKTRLQIELKYYGKDQGLAAKVADLIRREEFEDQCEVSSLDYEGLMKAKARNPRLKVVALVTYALGDPVRLDVDGLSVNANVLSDRLIRTTRARGKRLYVWTVDEQRVMLRLIERGVAGLVTNSPAELIEIRQQRAEMTEAERRLLAARYLLGLEEGP
jgi:glycerophosphoryl diester phosphodiesterase